MKPETLPSAKRETMSPIWRMDADPCSSGPMVDARREWWVGGCDIFAKKVPHNLPLATNLHSRTDHCAINIAITSLGKHTHSFFKPFTVPLGGLHTTC